eukprot:958524-Amphidinium_carterae.1
MFGVHPSNESCIAGVPYSVRLVFEGGAVGIAFGGGKKQLFSSLGFNANVSSAYRSFALRMAFVTR